MLRVMLNKQANPKYLDPRDQAYSNHLAVLKAVAEWVDGKGRGASISGIAQRRHWHEATLKEYLIQARALGDVHNAGNFWLITEQGCERIGVAPIYPREPRTGKAPLEHQQPQGAARQSAPTDQPPVV